MVLWNHLVCHIAICPGHEGMEGAASHSCDLLWSTSWLWPGRGGCSYSQGRWRRRPWRPWRPWWPWPFPFRQRHGDDKNLDIHRHSKHYSCADHWPWRWGGSWPLTPVKATLNAMVIWVEIGLIWWECFTLHREGRICKHCGYHPQSWYLCDPL